MDAIQFPVNSGYIQIIDGGMTIPAFWAHPSTHYAYSGIVLLHDHWGMTQDARAYVRRLAEAGFYCIAPDLYQGNDPQTAESKDAALAQLQEHGERWVNAALDVLCNHPHCNGKMGVVGWGTGATLTYSTASKRDDLHAAVAFSGDPTGHIDGLLKEQVPLLAVMDSTFDADIQDELRIALGSAPGESILLSYPHVGQDFMMSAAPTYDEQTARDAWTRALQFLYLQMGTPTVRQRRQVI